MGGDSPPLQTGHGRGGRAFDCRLRATQWDKGLEKGIGHGHRLTVETHAQQARPDGVNSPPAAPTSVLPPGPPPDPTAPPAYPRPGSQGMRIRHRAPPPAARPFHQFTSEGLPAECLTT
ncbi:hypothetical protein GCM10010297_15790 [Streptomyces malachitofuscus]|nr:hypothetical protein GCM10010297_15790 [Streptomyces malachitofuscus]